MQREVAKRIALLQVYIHIRKGVEVDIAPPRTTRELSLLVKAYDYANRWMAFNNLQTFPI